MSDIIDNWTPPWEIKIVDDFLKDNYHKFLTKLIGKRENLFMESVQVRNRKRVVQKEHKIRLDYILTPEECSIIDKEFLDKANCKCNLRERWRILYYNGDADEKAFRGEHTDWTSVSCRHRRMSIIIGLTDPSEYEGGELVFKNNDLKLKIKKGSAVIFDSRLVHEVLPVTKGKRYVIQAFLFDKSGFDIKKYKIDIRFFKLLQNNIKDVDNYFD